MGTVFQVKDLFADSGQRQLPIPASMLLLLFVMFLPKESEGAATIVSMFL